MDAALQVEQPARMGSERYAERVQGEWGWVRLLDLQQMNVGCERCLGAELLTADGICILDFPSGYGVHSVGHNHADVRALTV